MTATLVAVAIVLVCAYLVDQWPSAQPSGSRPVRLAHASTSGHDQRLSLATLWGSGNSSVRRDAQVRTVPGSTFSRSAMAVEPTHSPPWSSLMSIRP